MYITQIHTAVRESSLFPLPSLLRISLFWWEGTMEEENKKKQYHCGAPKIPRFAQSWCLLLSIFAIIASARAFDYTDALRKSLLYFEAQRSGRLPYNQRVTWRDHSGLTDGLEQGVSQNSQTPICPTFLHIIS